MSIERQKSLKSPLRKQIVNLQDKIVDTRSTPKRIYDHFAENPKTSTMGLMAFFGTMVFVPFLMDFLLFFMSVYVLFVVGAGSKNKLLFSTPMSSGTLNRKDGKYYDKNGKKLDGFLFLGNDYESNNSEIWFSDDATRRHMLLFGTTGAGKTEALLSICYGTLLACSGFIYTDGKGTFELFFKIYVICRTLAQEDNLLMMSFLTGSEDLRFPTTFKISNTCNPFANANQDAATQLLVSLMAEGGSDPMWKERASTLMEAVMGVLTYRRDYFRILISVEKIADMLILRNMFNNYKASLNVAEDDFNNPNYLPKDIQLALRTYLTSLPGFDEKKETIEEQPPVIMEQHGYLFMQFSKLLGSLATMYGYIFNTQLSEIDFWDVVVSRRVLVVLLPALAKSKNELSMLGKITIACIKQMMTSGLGNKSEGHTKDILEVIPTKSNTPFVTILDEYGYYAVQGSSVMPAQARGLGFFMIFAGQDFSAFAASSKEEAESIVSNCKIQICMALQDEKHTYDIFTKKGGQVDVAVSSGKEFKDDGKIRNRNDISYERRDLISFDDLTAQNQGEMHLLFEGKLSRGRFYYLGIEPKNQVIRLNHFLRVNPPTVEAANEMLDSYNKIKERISSFEVVNDLCDEGAENQEKLLEISKLYHEYDKAYQHQQNYASCATIAHILHNAHKTINFEKEQRNIKNFVSTDMAFIEPVDIHSERDKRYFNQKADPVKQDTAIPTFSQSKDKIEKHMNLINGAINNDRDVMQNASTSAIGNLNNALQYPKVSVETKPNKDIANILSHLNKLYKEEIAKKAA